jgi:hypothetical protein
MAKLSRNRSAPRFSLTAGPWCPPATRHWRWNWRETRGRIEHSYGYDKFPGNCHVVPNHAIIILSLLYSEDDFGRALMIAKTAGRDTDCNSGNVGCLMGIKNGLHGIDVKLREPVADDNRAMANG